MLIQLHTELDKFNDMDLDQHPSEGPSDLETPENEITNGILLSVRVGDVLDGGMSHF